MLVEADKGKRAACIISNVINIYLVVRIGLVSQRLARTLNPFEAKYKKETLAPDSVAHRGTREAYGHIYTER